MNDRSSPDPPWTYVAEGTPKPHVHPLPTPGGRVLTRVEPADHPWHRGLWFAIKYVDGENYWEEVAPCGTVEHVGALARRDDGVAGALRWLAPDGRRVVLREERRLAHVPLTDDAYALDVSVDLVGDADVVLDRTPYTTWGGYGGLTLRGAGDWVGTRLLLADGTTGDRVAGTTSSWCDLSGPDGGLAVLDAPTNVRHPSPWYASTRSPVYGDDGWSNFLNAAFLFHEPLSLPAGEHLRLDYRLVVHDGVWDHHRLGDAYGAWAAR